MPPYVTAAETVHTIRSNGLRAGQRVQRADRVVTTPSGRRSTHALDEETDETACGRSAAGLYILKSQSWEHLNPYLKCERCREVAG